MNHAVSDLDRQAIRAAVAGRDAWMKSTLLELVRAPSFSGHEEHAQTIFARILREAGFDVQEVSVDPEQLKGHALYSHVVPDLHGCNNLLAVLTPLTTIGNSLLVNGHADVVPTGDVRLWAKPPFTGYEKDGWVYGRGAGDMKGGLVAVLTAVNALIDAGLRPAGPLWFNTVVEEECTGNGALATVEHLIANGIKIDAMLDPEPFSETILSAQVGVFWAQLHLTGRPAHAMEAAVGLNPIEAAMHVWQGLKRLEATWNQPWRRHDRFRDDAHPLNFNLGKLAGGEWSSSVPMQCQMDFRCAFYPGVDPSDAKREVEECIRGALAELHDPPTHRMVFEGFHAPGCEVDLNSVPLRLLARCHEMVNGAAPKILAATATTDVRHFVLGANIPSTCYGPCAQRIHALDECVELASMRRIAEVYALFIAEWCGVSRGN